MSQAKTTKGQTERYGQRLKSLCSTPIFARCWWCLALPICIVALLAGCATCEKYSLTCRLWNDPEFREFNEPAPEPKLALFETADHSDVLVQYDACSEKKPTVIRRAYYLRANLARIDERQEPTFVNPAAADGLTPIPILASLLAATHAYEPPALYAVAGKGSRSFTLYQPGGRAAFVELPVYQESSGTLIRVALTPVAVAGDTAMVAAGLAVVAAVALAEGNYSFRIH